MMNGEGVIYGQCCEICVDNHSFMPIVVYRIKKGASTGIWGYSSGLMGHHYKYIIY